MLQGAASMRVLHPICSDYGPVPMTSNANASKKNRVKDAIPLISSALSGAASTPGMLDKVWGYHKRKKVKMQKQRKSFRDCVSIPLCRRVSEEGGCFVGASLCEVGGHCTSVW